MSLSPQDIHNSFSCCLVASGFGTSTSGALVLGADENPPTQANLSRFPRPKFRDCPPPIDRPAMALLSRFLITGYVFSIKGIRLFNRSFSKMAKPSTLSGAMILPVARSSFMALPLGSTTIIGVSLPSAYRLSRMTCGLPLLNHSSSSPPIPCRR